ncbi:hypothetical protein Tco_1523180 [Tanacetum coccineum]
MHTIVWRNKPEIKTLSLDDLFKNLKAYESEVKGTSNSTTNSHNVAFLSSSSTNNTSRAVNTTQGQEEFQKENWKEAGYGQQRNNSGLRSRRLSCFYCHKRGAAFAGSAGPQEVKTSRNKEPTRSDQAEEGPTNFALMALFSTSSSLSSSTKSKEKDEVQLTVQKFENSSKSLSKLLDRQIMDKCKTRLGYNAVPPPYTRNFMPPKSNLVYPSLDDFVDVNESTSESIVKKPTVETNEPKTARKEDGAPIIEDWVSESEEEDVPKIKTVEMFNKPSFAKINFVKSTKQVKSPRNTSVDKNRQNTPSPRGNKRNWNQQMS